MPLPKLVSPVYEIKTAIDKKIIKFVPFRVKEEKILLMSLESEDETQIKNAVITILRNCIVGKTKLEDLAIFDLEFLFLNIRAQSLGSTIDVRVPYSDDPDNYAEVSIDICEMSVHVPEGATNVIKINNEISLLMKYPSFDMFISDNFISGDKINDIFSVCTACIDQIVDGTEIHKASDSTAEELEEFIGSLDSKQFKSIQDFIINIPKLEHIISVINPKTEVETKVVLSGLGSFFQ